MRKTLKLPSVLLLAATALLLTACGATDPLPPPAIRFMPVPMPVSPPGEAVCDGEPCLSERQSSDLFNAVIDVACEANDKLAFLLDYYHDENLGPSCR